MDNQRDEIKENARRYINNIQAYDEYLNFIAYLIKVLGLPNNVISQSMLLKSLTDRGIFSKNRKLSIQYGINNDIVGFWGMHVIDGIVSCRHIANFQADVISKNHLCSKPFYCYMSYCTRLANFAVNHAINLIVYDGGYYGYDALSNKLFKFIDGMKMIELFTDQPLFAYYKPELKFVQNGNVIANISYNLSLFKKAESMLPINFEEYSYIESYTEKAIKQNEWLLNDFHEASKKYIKRITTR